MAPSRQDLSDDGTQVGARACRVIRCSVVIPTHEGAESLACTLEALAQQTLARDAYEVIVCDDTATEEIQRQVDDWCIATGIAARYVRATPPSRGRAAMRNAGWRAARGEIVAFTDEGVIPDHDWLRQGVIALDDDAADAASGRIVVPVPDEPTDYERAAAQLEAASFVTANCFCRRAVLASIGGFDPRFRTAWEDSDFYFRLITHGFDVVQANDAVVVHPVRPAPWGMSLRAERKHMYEALLYKKHRALYERFVSPPRPYLSYAILLAVGAVAWGVTFESITAVTAGLGAWCVLTGLVIARRLHQTRRDVAHVVEVVVTSLAVPFLSIYWRIRGGIAYRVAFW